MGLFVVVVVLLGSHPSLYHGLLFALNLGIILGVPWGNTWGAGHHKYLNVASLWPPNFFFSLEVWNNLLPLPSTKMEFSNTENNCYVKKKQTLLVFMLVMVHQE